MFSIINELDIVAVSMVLLDSSTISFLLSKNLLLLPHSYSRPSPSKKLTFELWILDLTWDFDFTTVPIMDLQKKYLGVDLLEVIIKFVFKRGLQKMCIIFASEFGSK